MNFCTRRNIKQPLPAPCPWLLLSSEPFAGSRVSGSRIGGAETRTHQSVDYFDSSVAGLLWWCVVVCTCYRPFLGGSKGVATLC